jgi:hypothetical protein
MPTQYSVHPGATFSPLPEAPGKELAFAIRSPSTGGLLDVSLDIVRLLGGFGAGATPEAVADSIGVPAEQHPAIAETADELFRLGLLQKGGKDQATGEIPPIFVIAAPGSVAARLQDALNAHPQLACTPLMSIVQKSHALHDRCWETGCFSALGLSRTEQLRPLGKALSSMLNEFARRRQKRGWVYNSRDLDLYLPFVDEVFDRKARYLAVIRHPLDTVKTLLSVLDPDRPMCTRGHDIGSLLRSHSLPQVAMAHYWKGIYSRVRAFREVAGNRLHVVRTENVLGALRPAELGRAFAFLGMEWVEPEISSELAPKNPGRLDPSATIVSPSGDPEIGLWKSWGKSVIQQTVAVLSDEAKAWGYSLPETGGAA